MTDVTVEEAEVGDRILVTAESNTDCIALTPDESVEVAMDLLDIAHDDEMAVVPTSDLRLVSDLVKWGRRKRDTVAMMGGAARHNAARRSQKHIQRILENNE